MSLVQSRPIPSSVASHYLVKSVCSPIHNALWVQGSCAYSPHPPLCESLRCGTGWILAVVSEAQHWRTKPVWMDIPAAWRRGALVSQSDNYTGPSSNEIKSNVPQIKAIIQRVCVKRASVFEILTWLKSCLLCPEHYEGMGGCRGSFIVVPIH